MKFCSKCGKELNDDAVVCLDCGCAVETEATYEEIASEKQKEPLPIFAICGLVLSGLGMITAFIAVIMMFFITFVSALLGCVAPVMFIAGLVTSIISCKKEKVTLSKIALLVSIVGTAISVILAIGLVAIMLWAVVSALIVLFLTNIVGPLFTLFIGGIGVISAIFGVLSQFLGNIEFISGLLEMLGIIL